MKYVDAVRHLEKLGMDVGPGAGIQASQRLRASKRGRVPILIAKNGTISKKLQLMIRQSRAEARKSL